MLKNKFQWILVSFIVGNLIPISFYLNRAKIKFFFPNWNILNNLRVYRKVRRIDNINNFKWFIPSQNHNIKNKDDLDLTRIKLKDHIIDRKSYKLELIKNFYDDEFMDFENLDSLSLLKMKNIHKVDSYARILTPKNPNKKLLIFHEGHTGVYFSKSALKFFNKKGYQIIILEMPLFGLNPPLNTSNGINSAHESLIKFNTKEKSFLSLFISPIVISLDYILENKSFDSISMVGISGGGWSTVLGAAADERINYSFPIAGTLPLPLRTYDFGDLEQFFPTFYNEFPYLDLYLLGSTGHKRYQMQISFLNDPCCFSGNRSLIYKKYLKKTAKTLNGSFEIFIDQNAYHHSVSKKISKKIHNKILYLAN